MQTFHTVLVISLVAGKVLSRGINDPLPGNTCDVTKWSIADSSLLDCTPGSAITSETQCLGFADCCWDPAATSNCYVAKKDQSVTETPTTIMEVKTVVDQLCLEKPDH